MRAQTILIIDDDAASRDLLRDVLEEAGFTVIAVGDAADVFPRLSQDVDLVLLDLVMPRATMDGFTFLSSAGARPELADTPVMILSGLGESVVEAIDPGTATALRIVNVISKPVEISTLLSLIHAVLDVKNPP